nr:hypothetical protein [Tanacetum cinerariifolium]
MTIAKDEPSVRKADARSGQWVDITMKKVHKLLYMSDGDEKKYVLDYTHVELHYVEDQKKNLSVISLSDLTLNMDDLTLDTLNLKKTNPSVKSLLAAAANQPEAGPPDVLRNIMSQLAQNRAMMNTVNQLAQQMDGNQNLASMMAGMGGPGSGSGDMSSMVQQMMPFVSQSLNRGSSSSNLLQRQLSRKPTLHRRHSSVKNLNINERSSSDFRMNLENAAQKIVEQYPPTEIFSSIVETAALHNNVFDSGAFDELCMEEELAQDFIEMLKRDISRRLQGRR